MYICFVIASKPTKNSVRPQPLARWSTPNTVSLRHPNFPVSPHLIGRKSITQRYSLHPQTHHRKYLISPQEVFDFTIGRF